MNGQVTIACAQLAPRFGEPEGNRERAAAVIDQAAARGAAVVVLPELCISGYAFNDLREARSLAEPIDGATVQGWSAQARERDVIIIGGLCELASGGALYNSAVVVDGDGVLGVYRKTHLWDREPDVFAAGSEPPPVIDTAIGRIGVAVCYDAFFPEVMRSLALAGAELIAVPMNSPAEDPVLEPLAAEVLVAAAAAHVNRVYVVQADRCGDERGIEWAQASVIVDIDGSLLAGPVRGETVLVASVALERAQNKALGHRNDAFSDRRPELYRTSTTTKETVS
jgi:predicted amidohydrolase